MYKIGWKPVTPNFTTPSARIRCLNIVEHLKSEIITLELFDEHNFAEKYDAVIFAKKTTDENLAQAQHLKDRGKIVIFDICDNQFFDRVKTTGINKSQEERLLKIFALADHITTTTTALKAVLEKYVPAKKITIIEDALEETLYVSNENRGKRIKAKFDLALYKFWLTHNARGKTRLIWFGTIGNKQLGTGIYDILNKKPFLEQERYANDIALTICSNGKRIYQENFHDWTIPVTFINWNASTFYQVLQQNHIALIPITKNPLTHCKSNNRVLTSLYNNLAVIADEIPSYTEFQNCIALNDWEKGMDSYLNDPQKRIGDAEKGKAIIQQQYTIEKIAHRWELFLKNALNHTAS